MTTRMDRDFLRAMREELQLLMWKAKDQVLGYHSIPDTKQYWQGRCDSYDIVINLIDKALAIMEGKSE